MVSGKERLDILLLERGLVSSREKGKALIIAGNVFVDDRRADKPGSLVGIEADIWLKEKEHPFVSRGGIKLEGALKDFMIDVKGSVCLDIGASTGGFTQCLLHSGAVHVNAVDVGTGQLAWELRNDSRVSVHEKTNARYITFDDFCVFFDIITIDVVFISLRHIFPVLVPLLKESGRVIALVKPQFEAGRGQVGKGGIVTDSSIHREVLHNAIRSAEKNSFSVLDISASKIKGSDGNQEFFLLLSSGSDIMSPEDFERRIEGILNG